MTTQDDRILRDSINNLYRAEPLYMRDGSHAKQTETLHRQALGQVLYLFWPDICAAWEHSERDAAMRLNQIGTLRGLNAEFRTQLETAQHGEGQP